MQFHFIHSFQQANLPGRGTWILCKKTALEHLYIHAATLWCQMLSSQLLPTNMTRQVIWWESSCWRAVLLTRIQTVTLALKSNMHFVTQQKQPFLHFSIKYEWPCIYFEFWTVKRKKTDQLFQNIIIYVLHWISGNIIIVHFPWKVLLL